jgi:hypothetical protein
VSSLTPLELLETFWLSTKVEPNDLAALKQLAQEILSDEEGASHLS